MGFHSGERPLAGTGALPSDYGLLGWNGPPYMATINSIQPTTQFYNGMKLIVQTGGTIGKVWCIVATLGSGLTSNQCLIGVYRESGANGSTTTLIGTCPDQSAIWASPGTAGPDSAVVTVVGGQSLVVVPGDILRVIILANGTTTPNYAGFQTNPTRANAGLAAGGSPTPWILRSAAGSQTALPSPTIDLSGLANTGTSSMGPAWVAVGP